MAKSKAPDGAADAASSIPRRKSAAATLLTEPPQDAAHAAPARVVTVDSLSALARRHLSEDERRELAKVLAADLPKRPANRPPGADTFKRLALVIAFVHRQAASIATTGERLPNWTAAREVVEHYLELWEAGLPVPWGAKRDVLGSAQDMHAQTRAVIRAYQRTQAANDMWIAVVAEAARGGLPAWPYPGFPVTKT
jgi:hypothetical protein